MLYTLMTIVHIIVCVVLATVVLLQSSKGGGLAGAFGGAGGASQQLLGSRGMTTLLHKLTIYLAVAFFTTSFSLYFLGKGQVATPKAGALSGARQAGELESLDQGAAGSEVNPLQVPSSQESTPEEGAGGEG